ncbi:MAG: hypothetical protein WD875_13110 [Pirellulales bacterium]
MSMSWRFWFSVPLAAAIAAAPLGEFACAAEPSAPQNTASQGAAKRETIRVHAYSKVVDGNHRDYFAACLIPSASIEAKAGADVVVLFDTSASQVAAFRDKALASLDALIARLGPQDRVHLMAVDLDGTPLTKSFVAAGSAELKAAVAKLRERTPLGSTDMIAALKSGAAAFESKSAQRRAMVYIGDGYSHANLNAAKKMAAVLDDLVACEIAVTTYSIGPRRNGELLANIANQTGGMMAIDGANYSAEAAGDYLTKSAAGLVAWPVTVHFPAGVEVFPARPIPLRFDRDTIVLGAGKVAAGASIEIDAKVAGRTEKFRWTAPAAEPKDDNAYLAGLIENARADGGAGLTTLGSDGLLIVRRAAERKVDFIAGQARQAVATDNLLGARPLIDELRSIDPQHPALALLEKAYAEKHLARDKASPAANQPKSVASEPAATGPASTQPAATIKSRGDATRSTRRNPFMLVALQQEAPPADDLFGDTPPADAPPADAPPADAAAADADAAPADAPAAAAAEKFAPPPAAAPDDNRFIDDFGEYKKRQNELIAKETEVEISEARRIMQSNPTKAKEDMKLRLDYLDRAADLYPEVRSQLIDKVTVAVRQAEKREASFEEEQAIRRLAEGQHIERDRIQKQLIRNQEKVRQLVEQFRVLLDEGSYEEADASVAAHIESIYPDSALATSTREVARATDAFRTWKYTYNQHVKRYNQAMLQVDASATPFPDNIPIIYPDAEFWESLTNRRKQYASVDLQKKGSAEEKIFRALGENADFTLLQMPLQQFADQIEQQHKIQVEIDNRALLEAGLDAEGILLSRDLRGISLRSALRLILKEHDLVYVVQNEVLLITTSDKALSVMTTKVYPVADLVLAIRNIDIPSMPLPFRDIFGGLSTAGDDAGGGGGLGGGGGGGAGF